jgi:multiple sugar transport system permease protein
LTGTAGDVARPPRPRRPRRPRWAPRSNERWFLLFVAPWLVGFIVLQAGPLLASAALAFTDWQPPAAARFIGLDNFVGLAADGRFIHALYNTAVYALWTVIPGLAIGLGLALLLHGRGRLRAGLRTTVFLPAVIAGVATAFMWGWVFNPRSGLVNGLLAAVGIRGPAWLDDPAWAMPAIVVMGLWNVGVNVVVYAAALNNVRRDLLETALLDGASAVARFRHVVWPALTPVTFYLAIVNAVAAFQVFTPTYVLTSGGPQDATLTTSLYTYEQAFAAGRLAYASAMNLVVLLLVVALTVVHFRLGERRVTYGAAEG